MKTYLEFLESMSEDAPTNNAGAGNIDGIGVGVNSEPGVKKSKILRWKRKKDVGQPTGQRRNH